MKEQEWKNEVFLTLMKRNEYSDISDLLETTKTTYNHLHDNYEELADLSSGPYDMSLEDALGKVAFELSNDPTLAGQVRDLFTSVTYDRIVRTVRVSDPTVEESDRILSLADDLAKEMLDVFMTTFKLRSERE